MVREVIGSIWDRTNRNNVNNNFEELYNGLGTAVENDKKLNDFLNGVGVVSSSMLKTNSVYGDIIRDGGIGTRHLLDSTVSRAKIQDGAVSKDKIADESVTHSKIGALAVDESNIYPNAVTPSKIADNAIGSRHVLNNTLGRSKLTSKFLFNRRIENSESIDSIFDDGTYIISSGNTGTFPDDADPADN